MSRRLLVLLAVLALVMTACGSSSDSSDNKKASATTRAASGQTAAAKKLTVEVDGKAPDFHAGFLAYFPKDVKVHPGDDITFHNNYSGEPHTVTFGTLVQAGLDAAKGSDPNGPPPPALAKLPGLLPDGPGDANQTAARPCIIDSGELPKNGEGCNGADQPFTGKQAFFNSGYLPPSTDNFKMKLASDIAPGTYSYFCLLHSLGMTGSIEVVAKGTPIPSAATVAKKASAERDAQLAKVKEAVAALPEGKVPALGFIPPAPNQVFAGSGSDAEPAPGIEEFGPKSLKIPVGGSVTWVFVGPHSVSFNPPKDATDLLVKGADGGYHVNEKANAPAGGPGVTPAEQSGPPDQNAPPPPPHVSDGGTWDGTGFRSSGVVASFPPALEAFKLTFSKAGSYNYVCLVHPGMTGTVQVG